MVACADVDRPLSDRCTHRSCAKLCGRAVHLHVVLGHPVLKRAWQTWKRAARAMGTFQARVLLTVFYALFVLPFGILARLFSDPLRIKRRPTLWLEHPDATHDLPWAKRQ
jgi:hypothetical protein